MTKIPPRQAEILARICDGVPNKVIARELNVSPRTIEHHTYRLFRKLGVHNRWEAAALVWRERVIELEHMLEEATA